MKALSKRLLNTLKYNWIVSSLLFVAIAAYATNFSSINVSGNAVIGGDISADNVSSVTDMTVGNDLTVTGNVVSPFNIDGTLFLLGSSSGSVGLKGAAAAGSTTYTLPSIDGSSGQFLSTNGSATLAWATAPGGDLNIRSVNTTDSATTSDDVILLSGASFTETLYACGAPESGKSLTLIHQGTSLTQVYTIDGNAAETVNSSASVALYTNGEILKILCNGSGNWIITDHKASTKRAAYTPTLNGWSATTGLFGYWTRMGSRMLVEFGFANNSGASAIEARVSLPGSQTYVASGNALGGQPCGNYGRNLNSGASTDHGGFMLQENSALSYITFSGPGVFGSSSVDFSAKANASAITGGTTDEIIGWCMLEITGWLP